MSSGRIFISYRRGDASATAGRLYDRLEASFGMGSVFMDVDSIPPGYDFAQAIEVAVSSCNVLLAVIDPGWLDATDEQGRRRLEDPDDFIVREIKTGLARNIPVIPVLVGGASPPRRDRLPKQLTELARRQGLRLDHDSFATDFSKLMTTLENTLSSTRGSTHPPSVANAESVEPRSGSSAAPDTAPTQPLSATPLEPVAPPAGPPKRRRPLLVALSAVAAASAIVALLFVRATPAGTGTTSVSATPPPPTTAVSFAPTTTCADVANGPSFVLPQPTDEGARSGLTFCPSHINGGRLPITGTSYDLAGQVLGPVNERQQVVLVNYGDPKTCDANGNPPARGAFLISQADIHSPDGRWSYTDHLGYDEAITIARHYEYLTGTAESILAVKNDRQNWNTANPGRSGDYPGILSMPADIKILATFDVPAGTYTGALPCQRN